MEKSRSLYLNRILALKTEQFHSAYADVESLLAISAPTEKALFRKGQALYSLERYKKCREIFEVIRSTYSNNTEAQDRLNRANDRLAKQEQGTNAFKKLQKEADKFHPPHLEHASFVGNVAVREAGESRGRGLFTTERGESW